MEWLLSYLPAPGTIDGILLALFVGPALLLGVPVLRAVIRIPRRMSIEQVSDAELSPAVREFFARVESRRSQPWRCPKSRSFATWSRRRGWPSRSSCCW